MSRFIKFSLGPEAKNLALGCFEIAIFMRAGIERFSASRADAVKSFIIPLCLFPLSIAGAYVLADHQSYNALFTLCMMRTIVTTGLFFGIVYLFCRQYERGADFFRAVSVMNWANVIGMTLALPIPLLVMGGFAGAHDMENYALFITLMGYAYIGFILTHALRIPWELGGALAMAALAIDQNAFDLFQAISRQISG